MIIFHLYYDLLIGGIQTMLVNIANEQVRMGHQVKLLILNDAIDESLRNSLNAKIELVCFKKKSHGKNIFPVLKLNAYLYTHKFDMLHMHNPRLSIFVKISIDQQHKCCTQHCLCNGGADSDYLHNFDNAFAISDAVKQDIKDKYGKETTTVYNGIIPSTFKSDGVKKNADGYFHIVQVGRFHINVKGQDIVVKALAKLRGSTSKGIKIDFIGDNEGKGGDTIKRLVDELQLSESVNFLGVCSQQFVAEHLCEYDLYIQPSRKEGFGLTVAEAMAAKVPVLVSDVPGPMDVISNGEFGFYFKSENVDDCANKILSIVEDKKDIRSMVESAYKKVLEKFNVSVTAKSYIDNYLKIIGYTKVVGAKLKIKSLLRETYLYKLKKKWTDRKMAKKREPYLDSIRQLIGNNTSIISSNCFAGRVMQDLKMEYISPTLGLWMMPDDFAVFCSDLNHYLNSDITIVEHSKNELGEYKMTHPPKHPYPVGWIDGKLEVHFLHYHTAEEAVGKWKRRAARVNYDNLLLIGSEQNGCTEEDVKTFDAIPYPKKLYFCSKPYPYKSVVYIHEFSKLGHAGDPYKQGHIYYKYFVKWLKENETLFV